MPKFSPVVPRRRRISSSLAVLALAVLTAAGCDSSTGNDDSIFSVAVNPPTPVLHVGGTQQLVATPATSSGKILEGRTTAWSSSNPAVATVDGNGLVTAIAPGTSTVSATVGNLSDDAVITVWYPVQSISLAGTGGATTMCQEGSLKLIPTVTDASNAVVTGRQFTWTTSNPVAAVVSPFGTLTGGPAGGPLPSTATITATSEGVSATFDITTNCPAVVVEVELVPTLGANMAVGMTDQFEIIPHAPSGTVLDTAGREVTFESSDTLVATVSATGLVEMVGEGEADITGSVDGESATVTVTSYDQIMSGEAINTGLLASGSSVFYLVDVPSGTTSLTFTLGGGTGGDPDIYAYDPTGENVDASFNSGPGEQIVIENPTVGRWVIEVNAWDGAPDHDGAVLTATLNPAPPIVPVP